MVTPATRGRLDQAYETCARLARDHYENFPVASRLLPPAMRPHVAAVYAFARMADDFADEGREEPANRLARLDAWRSWLHGEVATAGLPPETPDIFAALGATMRACSLPVTLFEDLLSAFAQDVTTTRYGSWAEVLDYCRRSANPVGRLVLRIAGYANDDLDRSSDAVCSALQLTNFWQDLERDWINGRLYVPLEDCRREGADPADLDARRMSPAWRAVLARAGARTAALFDEGRLVCERVPGRLGLELRLTWLGGRRILERLERQGYDVFGRRPALGAFDLPVLAGRLLTWQRA